MDSRAHHLRHISPNGSTTSSTNSNGLRYLQPPPPSPTTPTSAALPPTRSDSGNPNPTMFVQADTATFKEVVQLLTGSSKTARLASIAIAEAAVGNSSSRTQIPPVKTVPHKKQQPPQPQSGFKLYERRNNSLHLNPLLPAALSSKSNNAATAGGGSGGFGAVGTPLFSPRTHHYHHQEVLSPSMLDFPGLVLSPVTPLIPDPFGRFSTPTTPAGGPYILDTEAEERAIKAKGFFFHPPPPKTTTPRDAADKPRLLPLFPTSAAAGPSSSA